MSDQQTISYAAGSTILAGIGAAATGDALLTHAGAALGISVGWGGRAPQATLLGRDSSTQA